MFTLRTKHFSLDRDELYEAEISTDRLHRAADLVDNMIESLRSGIIEWTITKGDKLVDHGMIIGG
jgi:hypothetical protein